MGLAVTPGGRALVAWTNGLAVRAVEGDAAPVTLASIAGVGVPVVALNDDGDGVVAFPQLNPSDDRDIAVLGADRAAGGPWSSARRLVAPRRDEPDADVDNLPLATALAPGGRALVAWPVLDRAAGFDRMLAASGSAGGAWTPASVLSLPTRASVGAPAAWVDAAGDPRVAWIEDPARLRADRLVADAQLDRTGPRLTAALPRTMRVNGHGIRPVRLTVRCDEACDVRAAILVPGGDSVPEADAVRAVPAGKTVHITIRQQGASFLPSPAPRHVRLRVIAADRAGNVAERSRLVAVNRR
jgi:hypothetical protein